MDEQLNKAPCGFMTLSKNGNVLSVNEMLMKILDYPSQKEVIIGTHIHTILPNSSRLFFQLYFMPLIMAKHFIEEMHLTLISYSGEEIPVLLNAALDKKNQTISCIFFPTRKRNKLEDELLHAKQKAEIAYEKENKALIELKGALQSLEDKQKELEKLNEQNHTYKVNTEKELKLAKKIQETALTRDITNERIEILSFYRASHELSGDIFGVYNITPYKYGVILLDVMGHGISSALITMSLQSLFHRLISEGVAAELVMQELDQHLHNLFYNNQSAWHYCTAIYLLIDTKRKTIEYINGGHTPALFQDLKGEQKELHSSSPPLGMFEGIEFTPTRLSYKNGSRLLLYTDGVSEPLGTHNLSAVLRKYSTSPLSTTKQQIVSSLLNIDVDANKNDDQCFLLIDLK
ncbi:SpoIIE family protein phosphatase [Radiobacillus deserti]|uniref:SpoIIE family protein phosphatase n=1 Tax=Radiobacillus deserti TaxID=2594883 RepID=A0A516KKM8_9BACI|nr:SpoIIE family protein phosphatase [Radiobacillus deserti]QDP41932.1 SpoIIE family protein phosphatase [Radiobacillus deserti]